MNIEELVRRARSDSSESWARSEAGQQVLNQVLSTGRAEGDSGRTVRERSLASWPALRWSFAGTGLVGVATAAVLVASMIVPAGGESGPDVPPAGGMPATGEPAIGRTVSARDILLAAATRAEQTPAETGRYWHVKTLNVFGPQRVGAEPEGYWLLRRSVEESWDARDPGEASWTGRRDLGARPRGAADEQAWRAAGSPTRWTLEVDGKPGSVVLSTRPGRGELRQDTAAPRYLEDLGQLTLAQVRQLPDDQHALRDWVTGRIRTEVGHAPGSGEGNQLLFGFLSRLLLDTPAPPKVRAAAFRVLADIPGVRGLGTVTDDSGRSGQGIELTGPSGTTRLVIDTATHLLLATTTIAPGGPAMPAHESSTLVLAAEWSDAAPRVPSVPQQ